MKLVFLCACVCASAFARPNFTTAGIKIFKMWKIKLTNLTLHHPHSHQLPLQHQQPRHILCNSAPQDNGQACLGTPSDSQYSNIKIDACNQWTGTCVELQFRPQFNSLKATENGTFWRLIYYTDPNCTTYLDETAGCNDKECCPMSNIDINGVRFAAFGADLGNGAHKGFNVLWIILPICIGVLAIVVIGTIVWKRHRSWEPK